MRVVKIKKSFEISFDSNNETAGGSGNEEEKDIIEKFIQKCPYFDFPPIENEEIQKFKKKVVAFAIQYNIKNEKTTAIFLNFLENVREIATAELKKRDYESACSYYAVCLGFIDPQDEIFLQKFIATKIDIINKMMYSLFCLYGSKPDLKYMEWSQSFLEKFLSLVNGYAFYSNLIKSEACMLELNFFYLGRVHRKMKNNNKAIEAFSRTQEIIVEKQHANIYQKNDVFHAFCTNLEIKTFYKISKCYREDDQDQQAIYEGLALRKAQQSNQPLYQYINRKVRMHKSCKLFHERLAKMEGKKKIEQEVLRKIEEAQQKQTASLYDVYLDSGLLAEHK